MLMRAISAAIMALSLALATGEAASGATLGDPQIGFSAERVLVIDGQRYVGRMWNMPGEQRHEQQLPALKPIFILRADRAIGDVVLPQLHTVVEFEFPKVLAALGKPAQLGKPAGNDTVNGVATTRYAIDRDLPEGHATGSLWLSRDGIPMKCEARYTARNGKVSTIYWELRDVRIGPQDPSLFVAPADYAKLPPEAAAQLLGLRLASPHRRD
jgi:hypothetical protein